MDIPAPELPGPPDEPQVTAVLRVLLPVLAHEPPPGRPVIVGIDGPSGAGKSTLARELAGRLGADDVAIVMMDELYPGWDGLEAATGILARDVLEPLATGAPAGYPRWDWLRHRPSRRRVPVPAARVVIVEGAGSCARRCAPFLCLQIWLDAPEPVRFERAMARDGDSYRPHWQRWAAQEREHFRTERTAERAGLRLDVGPGLC